jgi:hypothetical protein
MIIISKYIIEDTERLGGEVGPKSKVGAKMGAVDSIAATSSPRTCSSEKIQRKLNLIF